MVKSLTPGDLDAIIATATTNFDALLTKYNEAKYPPDAYSRFKAGIATGQKGLVESALRWKWGHTNKKNCPLAHKQLADRAASLWGDFMNSPSRLNPQETFRHWLKALRPSNAVISSAFITHLVHPNEIAIVDQHNFRAMNALIRQVRPAHVSRAAVRRWEDVQEVSAFVARLSERDGRDRQTWDRYLMMHGKELKKAKNRNSCTVE